MIFMCQSVQVMLSQGDDKAICDAGPFRLEGSLRSDVCDSI